MYIYCIVQLCGGRKYWRIWRINCHSPIFYQPILSYQLNIFTLKSKIAKYFPKSLEIRKLIRQYFPSPHNCAIQYLYLYMIIKSLGYSAANAIIIIINFCNLTTYHNIIIYWYNKQIFVSLSCLKDFIICINE